MCVLWIIALAVTGLLFVRFLERYFERPRSSDVFGSSFLPVGIAENVLIGDLRDSIQRDHSRYYSLSRFLGQKFNKVGTGDCLSGSGADGYGQYLVSVRIRGNARYFENQRNYAVNGAGIPMVMESTVDRAVLKLWAVSECKADSINQNVRPLGNLQCLSSCPMLGIQECQPDKSYCHASDGHAQIPAIKRILLGIVGVVLFGAALWCLYGPRGGVGSAVVGVLLAGVQPPLYGLLPVWRVSVVL